jgi:translation initiation factor 2 subunit 3
LFDTAVGSTGETKVTPIKADELLRVSVGTAPVPAKVTKVKSDNVEIEFKRPVCIFEKGSVALSRRIAERWRLIGAGVID